MTFRLYLDEMAPCHWVEQLKKAGLDATCARDAGCLQMKDDEQLEFAAKEGRVLVTFDAADYQQLHSNWLQSGRPHSGIILLSRRYLTQQSAAVPDLLKTLQSLSEPSAIKNNIMWISGQSA